MKKLLFLGVGMLILLSFFILSQQYRNSIHAPAPVKENERVLTPTPKEYTGKKLIFVPYWTMSRDDSTLSEYEEIVYFGISVDRDGIDTQEEGYRRIERFKELAPPSSDHFLTVRIINSDIESLILKDKELQQKVITESVKVAREHGFDGILLDYESSALGFAGTIQRITDLHRAFSESVQKDDLLFYSVVYGDTYFRSRPYEIGEIEKVSDKVVVMAYDFHKARGEAGPNFPYEGDEYPYDFQQMISDFSKDVPSHKLTITLGFFGYDWSVDSEGNTISLAEPLSYLQGKGRFLDGCTREECLVVINKNTKDARIGYRDEEGVSHIVWFETPDSAQRKIEYMTTKGIKNVGWWAYSFF